MPPLILVAIAWMAGLVAAHHILVPVGVEPASIGLLALIPLMALLLWHRDRPMLLAAVCTLALLGGVLRYQLHVRSLHAPQAVATYNDQGWVTLEGMVQGYPDTRDLSTRLEIEIEQLEFKDQAVQVDGRVLVLTTNFPRYRYGDQLRISGMLETAPELEGFSYREYLAQRGILSYVRHPRIEKVAAAQGSPFGSLLYSIKDRAYAVIARLMPEPEASLLQGILLGIRSGIPRDLYEDYNDTGTSHIIVISGANIMIVAVLFSKSFGWLMGKQKAYWFTLAGISLYVLLVGADPVVVRAGIMGSLLVTATYLGRRATAYVTLAAATMLLTLINPLTLWNIGFQLSVAATLSLILFTTPMEQALTRLCVLFVPRERAERIVRILGSILVVTLAAQVLTLPLVSYHFGRLSVIAPLTNLFILSIQPHIMGWGAVATLVGLVPPLEPIARVIAMVPWLLLAFTNTIVRWMAQWQFAALQISRFHMGWLVALYGLSLGLLWALRQPGARARQVWNSVSARTPAKALLVISLMAIVLTILALLQQPDGRLHVAFLDVGQGDAIFITTPKGQQILVDGGPGTVALTSALGQEMPFWDHDIDLLVLTHADIDHVSGLVGVLERYQIGGWLDNGAASESKPFQKCQELLKDASIPRQTVKSGDWLHLGRGVDVEVLHPDAELAMGLGADSNNGSVVLRLTWQEASFLLTGDLEAEGESHLMQSGQALSADVLKISHHGSGGASTEDFLAAVAPSYAVISAGAENKFNHPDPVVLERLDQLGAVQILRTDEQGTVEFITDGHRMWVSTER